MKTDYRRYALQHIIRSHGDLIGPICVDRRLSAANNVSLIQVILLDEVIQAITALQRHKAGLNNDFFKDTQAVLVPAMITIMNELLAGGKPPPFFLQGLILPLRKKGDSADAMDAAGSRAILLLDFRIAYDTVSREFLFLALERFGFSHAFTKMIRNIHEETTAQFVVNGEHSQPQEVVSGIRQRCPLAPFLFLVVAEILAFAI